MFSRISSALSIVACLSACSVKGSESGDEGGAVMGEAGKTVGVAPFPSEVPCALGGSKEFKDECQVERVERDGKSYLVVRHPDGGFRRLVEHEGGKRWTAADGAEEAVAVANGKEVEVTVDDDHYLFPAPAQSHAAGS